MLQPKHTHKSITAAKGKVGRNMEVLVIDDQMNVIEGIRRGIDWELLHISQVYEATNIQDAKEIIRSHHIQIMVCDIEMPMGNGIELLHWVRNEGYPIECIFLTAYAKFEYANEAIKLNAFDYVLQPVKYEELTRVLSNALDKIRQDTDQKALTDAGAQYQKNSAVYISSVLKGILDGNSDLIEYYLADQFTQAKGITAQSLYLPIYLSVLRIENYEIASGRKNLLSCIRELATEAYGNAWAHMLLIHMANHKYLLLSLQKDDGKASDLDTATEGFLKKCKEEGLLIAAYMGEASEITALSEAFMALKRMDEKNVGGYSNLFKTEQPPQPEDKISRPNWNRYEVLLQNRHFDIVRSELSLWLQNQQAAQCVTDILLFELIQDFLRTIYCLQKEMGARLDFLLHEEEGHALYINAAHSVESALFFVDYVLQGLKNSANTENLPESMIEQVCDYIDRNIEKDITRSSIAEAVHINPEYLSKVFKKEKGIGLSNYITEEKVKRAKSYLDNTSLPISVIASKLGYSNFSYFSKIFKTSTGVLPNDYRREKS